MILVDTSVSMDQVRSGNASLAEPLHEGNVCTHPFVIGELACGSLGNRDEVLTPLRDLPQALLAADDEALRLVAGARFRGKGIGRVDAHLPASARLTGCPLWTFDCRLSRLSGAWRPS